MLKLKLSPTEKSINEILKEIRRYRKKVEKAAPEITKRLTEQGVSLAQQNASYMDIYDSGALVNGIEAEYVGGFGVSTAVGKVHSTAPHSAFCEFGTGIVGQGSQHPDPMPGWTYDVNEHGEDGWWYYDESGQKRWTKGMPSRPYMHDTAKMLRNMVPETARGVLK